MIRPHRTLLMLFFLLFGFVGEVPAQTQFWDEPEVLVQKNARFPSTVDNGKMAVAMWQERRSQEGWPQYTLTISTRKVGENEWTTRKNILGPFTQPGDEAQIYTVTLSNEGQIWVAVLIESGQIRIYRSNDEGLTFTVEKNILSSNTLLFPRLFLNSSGQPMLLVNQGGADSFRIAGASFDGKVWTDLAIITDEGEQRLNFQPFLLAQKGKMSLFYQALLANERPTYQIYLKTSVDDGKTWSPPKRLSDFSEDPTFGPNDYDNQRPHALVTNDRLYVAWERRTRGVQPTVNVITYNLEGKRIDAQQLTQGTYTAGNPQLFEFQDKIYMTWFDNRRDVFEQFLSVLNPAVGWGESELLSDQAGNSYFGHPVRLGSDLFFFWQNNFGTTSRIVLLKPDRFVDVPQILPVNFKVGERTNKPDFSFDIAYPKDRSGIAGFNFSIDQSPESNPEQNLRFGAKEKPRSVKVATEGTWYLHVIVQDLAGNWSKPTNLPLLLKTTPPKPVLFEPPQVDSLGFLVSNTFKMKWSPSSDDTRAYSWRLDRVGELDTPVGYDRLKIDPAPRVPTGTETEASFSNLEDGIYALSVAPFDEAGNQGQTYSYFFRLNKFRPFTRIFTVDSQTDSFGRTQLEILGRGFTAGGRVIRVLIDKDGQAPWDLELDSTGFRLASDRSIQGILLPNLEPGVYRVGVDHSQRGLLFTGAVLKIEPSGTVKIGDFRDLENTQWVFFPGISVFFSVNALYFWALMTLLFLVTGFSIKQMIVVGREMRRMDRQAEALFTENYYQGLATARGVTMKRKGLSLAVKFVLSILSLTIAVILMLSLTLGFFITENSQRNLGTGLQQRTEVLLDSLSSGARAYLPSGNTLELSLLPGQISAMDDAVYTTITGRSVQDKVGFSFVWASNDPDLLKKLDTPTLIQGVSRLKDPIEESFEKLKKDLNQKADDAVADLATEIDALNKKAQPYTLRTDAESQRILADYQTQITKLQNQVNQKLSEIGHFTGSLPEFHPETLVNSPTTRYVFYKPVIYRTTGDKNYVKGLIRLAVSTDKILKQISSARDQLILLTGLIALIALALGLVGAFILSTLTINPIRKLVGGVEKIRDTEDKAELKGHVIDLHTRDELSDLANTINQMTQGLVHAAEANKDLLLGKTTQKTFIPLNVNSKGRKLTTGYLDLPEAEIFGYYEGAKGVSGDYYDFRQLDNKEGDNPKSPWYGFIKCDVSGKGIVGALIMFTVASIVVNFFRNWTSARDAKDIQLKGMVANINDLLESLQFKGRFAALNTGILNVQTGKIRLCHAGDNVVHVWRGRTGTFETTTLPAAPATGQIADFMARNLYQHHDLVLAPGDTLLFYTDGIEESQSKFRDAAYNAVAFFDPNDPTTKTAPGTRDGDRQAIDNEPLHEPATAAVPPSPRNPEGTPASEGNERLNAIIEAFYQRRTYNLVKKYPARPEETLTFDFSTCDGSAKQVITALVSIDRVFRLVADPNATVNDRIKLDVIQKEFLEKHFVEYKRYFRGDGEKVPEKDETKDDSEYVWFPYLKEDDQFDDLTLLAIRKK